MFFTGTTTQTFYAFKNFFKKQSTTQPISNASQPSSEAIKSIRAQINKQVDTPV